MRSLVGENLALVVGIATSAGRAICLALAAATAAACNGDGSADVSGAETPGQAAARGVSRPKASPGGIWHALDGTAGSLTLMIAESGELKLYGAGPAFGSGAVVVAGDGRLAGSFDVRGIASQAAGMDSALLERCELEGSIVERVSIDIELTCAGAGGEARAEHRTLLFDAHYMSGASLDEIAGNYTLPFDRDANSLSISDDGVVFGVYDNGPSCTIGGEIGPVEHAYNLYRTDWTLSNCAAPHERFEGATFTGLGFSGAPGRAPDTLLLLLTGTVEGRFEFLSLIYEPA